MRVRCRQACEACRARKLRCLPGATIDTCKRCEDTSVTCVPHQALKRRTPTRRRPGYRFVDVVGQVAESRLRNDHHGNHAVRSEPGEPSDNHTARLRTPSGVGNSAGRIFGETLLDELQLHIEGYSSKKWTAFEELTEQQCLFILNHYKNRMIQAVPFALLLPDLPLDGLRSKHPILLLSILLTASSSLPEFQKQADEIFRRVIADRVVIKGQRSLQLLQGLLTYLTWYNQRFDPETQQFYQLQQMATAMAADLRLWKKFTEEYNDYDHDRDNAHDNKTDAMQVKLTTSSPDDLNQLRAFLLCYYLDCGTAVLGYDRPGNMHCIRSLRNAAQLLARSASQPLDTESPAIIELMYIAAQHRAFLNDADSSDREASSPLRRYSSSETALGLWRDKHLHAQTPCVVRSSYHYIYTYSLLKRARSAAASTSPPSPSPGDLVSCLETCQAQLSNILQQGPSYLVLFGIVEWAPILTYLFLLPRLEASVASTGTGTGTATTSATTSSTSIEIQMPDFDTNSDANLDLDCHLTPRTRRIVGRLRLQLAELKATAVQVDTMLQAPNFFHWLDLILSASERCALTLQNESAQSTPGAIAIAPAPVDGGGSAYELIHSYTDVDDILDDGDNNSSRQPPPREIPNLEQFWVDFMSDWLQW